MKISKKIDAIKKNSSLLITLFFSLLITCWVERSVFTDTYAINDDVRNQAYWMLRLVKPHLFSGDLAASYFCQPALVSPLLKGIYLLASQWMNPIRFSQFLPFIIAPVTTILWFLVAERWLNQRFAFWSSLVLNCAIWMTPMLAGGLPRSFFYPLIFSFFWAFSLKISTFKKSVLLSLILVIQSLIYPTTLLLSVGLLIFDLVRKLFQPQKIGTTLARITPRLASLTPNILAIASGVSSCLIRYAATFRTTAFGPLMTGHIAEHYAEFYPGGRVPVFFTAMGPNLPEHTLMGILQDIYMRLPELPYLIFLIACLIFSIFGKKLLLRLNIKTPQVLIDLPWVAMILYIVAISFLFSFYVPIRYLDPSLHVIVIFLIGAVLYWLEGVSHHFLIKTQLKQNKCLCAVVTSLLILIVIVFSAWRWKTDLIQIPTEQKNLFQMIKIVPENSRISASYWIIANNIPLFSERAVLLNREVNIPFHLDYYRQMKTRFLDWLTAYYTDKPEIMAAYIQKYQIDYLVASTWDFTDKCIRNRKAHFTKDILPSDFIPSALQKVKMHSFWLAHIDESSIIGQSGPYRLINAKRLLKLIKHTHEQLPDK